MDDKGGTTPSGNVRPERVLVDSKLDKLGQAHAQKENQHQGSDKNKNWGGQESESLD